MAIKTRKAIEFYPDESVARFMGEAFEHWANDRRSLLPEVADEERADIYHDQCIGLRAWLGGFPDSESPDAIDALRRFAAWAAYPGPAVNYPTETGRLMFDTARAAAKANGYA